MKLVLKNTETQAVVKVGFTAGGTETIALNTDLIIANRVVLDGKPFKVNISAIAVSGVGAATFTITRNGQQILAGDAQEPTEMIFDEMGFTDSQEQASNIVVTVTGNATLYLSLRKQQGYVKTFEPELFGPYDDPTVVGS